MSDVKDQSSGEFGLCRKLDARQGSELCGTVPGWVRDAVCARDRVLAASSLSLVSASLSVSRMNCVASRANWLSGIFTPEISLTIMVHPPPGKARTHAFQVRAEVSGITAGFWTAVNKPALPHHRLL